MFRTFYRMLVLVFCPIVWTGTSHSLCAMENRFAALSADDTLTIRSALARMDEIPDIVHFEGGFELNAPDWSLSSDRATLYGNLDDPETVVIRGKPALIRVDTVLDGKTDTVTGEADQITYQRESNSIRLEGNAYITRNEHNMSGGQIEYDIDRDYLTAGGDGGVRIVVSVDLLPGNGE